MLYRDPDALMRGAGVWADAATGLQGMENWLDAHPALLSLMKNTGSVVGGAIWLSKLTPAGLVTGLVVNYGYEKLLKLMEGNIEVAKEHLTTYFQAYDEDITPEQASYLANCAMKVLQTAGQIAVHQAAAKGFNKVRRGVDAGRVRTKGEEPKLLPKPFNKFSRFEYHFNKHVQEFGGITKEAYYKRALSLLESQPGGNVVGFTNKAGFTFRMNMETGEFGVMRPNGIVETFYRRTKDPAAYWAEQISKWNT